MKKIFYLLPILFFSCDSHDYGIVLPQKDYKKFSNIKEFESEYPLVFVQYLGFVGTRQDSIFNQFTVLSDFSLGDIVSDKQILELKEHPFWGIKFNKVSNVSLTEVKVWVNKNFKDVSFFYDEEKSILHLSNSVDDFGYVEENNSGSKGYILFLN